MLLLVTKSKRGDVGLDLGDVATRFAHQLCAGNTRDCDQHIDVVACLLAPGPDGQTGRELRTFSTMTADLLVLGDWLADSGCTHVAMESTGVYWKPIYNLLELLN